jgi:hypothetical protein
MMRHLMFAWLLIGCDPEVMLSSNDVIVGLTATPSAIPANGAAATVISVQTVSDDVESGLKAKLSTTAGTWVGVMGSSVDADLGPDGLASAALVAPRMSGELTITAEIAGYQRTISVALEPVAPTSFTSTTSGSLKAGEVSQVQITVAPTVTAGGPTVGTVVAFSLTATPDASAYLTTTKVIIDSAATAASTTVVAGTTTMNVVVSVSVTPPGGMAPTASGSITVQRLP